MKPVRDDPDETEGRCIYRAIADFRARVQINIDKRNVRLAPTQESSSG